MRLNQRTRKNIQNINLLNRGDTVIVGVSGGPDSVALVHILHDLQYELGFFIHIAHFNHNLHRSALADQKFVEQLAERLNAPCSVGTWKNPKALKNGSLEDVARKHRFKFFGQLARKINAQVVALAHTEDDLAETVLMRILRGTGLRGLRGILPRRKLQGVCFVRPFLNVKKKDVVAYLNRKNISFRVDPTNEQKRFFRNKIRIELLPLLSKRYNRNIKALLVNLANTINTDYDFLENHAQKLFYKLAENSTGKDVRFNLNLYNKHHLALRRMLIRIGIEHLKGDAQRLTLTHFREIEDMLTNRPQGSTVHLPQNMSIHKSHHHLTVSLAN